jgi:aerobic C4-dicarboxylate transport protein
MSTQPNTGSIKKPFYYSFTFQLAMGLLIGAGVGLIWPVFGAQLNPLAIAFVKLIKMIAGLIVFLTVLTGVAQIKRGSGLGRLGGMTLLYFEVISTLALVLGLVLGNLFKPGAGLSISR